MKRLLCLALIAAAAFAVQADAVPLTILYTNDLHLRFERLDSLERLIAEQRGEVGELLVLDAGDAWQDFRRPTAAVWGGAEMVAWMNRVGYDAMALGNHEAYWGLIRLAELAEQATFPLLSANLRPTGSQAVVAPFVRLSVRGLSIEIIGLTTPEYFPFSADFGWRYVPSLEALRDEIALSSGDDLLVVLAHLPVADAAAIAKQIPGIDVFVTGHSHEETPQPVVVGETVIVQSGQFGRYLGRLDLEIDAEGQHHVIGNRLIPTEKAPVDGDRGLRQLARVLVALAAVLVLVLF